MEKSKKVQKGFPAKSIASLKLIENEKIMKDLLIDLKSYDNKEVDNSYEELMQADLKTRLEMTRSEREHHPFVNHKWSMTKPNLLNVKA